MTATVLTIGVPAILILFGILTNRSDVNSLRGEINAMRKQQHDDMITLLNILHEHDMRITKLEA